MKRFSSRSFKKIFILLVFSFSCSFASVSFAQEESGFFNWMSSFLTTSFLPKSDTSRMDILFASPRKNIISQTQEKETVSSNNIKSVPTENSLLNVLRSKRILTDQDVENIQKNVSEESTKKLSIPVKSNSSIKQNSTASCSDSDGGINTAKKGQVRWKMGKQLKSFMDESLEDGVIEYSCENNSLRGDFIDCEYGSKDGACETKPLCPKVSCAAPQPGCVYKTGKFANGCENPCAEVVCEESETEEILDEKTDSPCRDTDGGMNFYEKGFLTGTMNGVSQEHVDTCYTEMGGTISMKGEYVKEWYCSGEYSIAVTGLTCPNGCVDGACIQKDDELLTRVRMLNVPNTEIIAGARDAKVFQFAVENVSEKNMTIHNVSFLATGTGNSAVYENFESRAFINGVQQGSYQHISPGGKLSFSDMATSLPSHEEKEFIIIFNTIEASAPGTIGLSLVDIQEDLMTGEEVVTMFGSQPLSSSNKINGPVFQVVKDASVEGTLMVDLGATAYSDILMAGQDNVDIMKIQFHAMDDEIRIKDLYFENDLNNDESPDNTDVGVRMDFKLYNENGQLLRTKAMVNGSLHFEIDATNPVIVPQNGSSFVTIKGDVRDITNENQTGKRLQLSLDGSHNTKGIEAIAASTGNYISTPTTGWEVSPGNITGEDFVLYRTKMALTHASTQPNFGDPISGMQEVYRFTATADASREVEMGKVTLHMSLAGMESAGNQIVSDDVEVHLVEKNGRINPFVNVGTAIVKSGSTVRRAEIEIDFNDQRLSSGEQRTYTVFLGNLTNNASLVPDDDAIITMLKLDNDYSAPSARGNQSGYIVWSDISSSAHSDTSIDWENGYLSTVDTTSMVVAD